MSWLFIGLLVFFVAAAAFTAIVRPSRSPAINVQFGDRGAAASTVSFVGVDNFDTTDGGVTFDNVEPPGSPADKAGLVGGDIITSFDGKVVTTDDEITDVLRQTPIGKTVDVVFIRDGSAQTVKLTTISRAEGQRLKEVFDSRAGGRAQLGYEDSEAERVAVPNTKMFGVRLGEILANRPADIAGVKEGDIVIEFDGIPIRTTGEFLSRVRRAEPYSTIKLLVLRGQEKLEIPVKMGKA
jgi:serine protease Do